MTTTFNFADLLARSTDKPFDEATLALLLKALPPLSPKGPWLAGGAIRRTLLGQEPESDLDIFFPDAMVLDGYRRTLEGAGLTKVRETEHHIHFHGPLGDSAIPRDIQLIRIAFYANPAAVIESFDFTICQFAFDGETLTVGDYALWDLGRKRLAVHKITFPVSSARRMLKYAAQGFVACSGCLNAVVMAAANNPELRTDIEYVD
jgi:hypothetical protein